MAEATRWTLAANFVRFRCMRPTLEERRGVDGHEWSAHVLLPLPRGCPGRSAQADEPLESPARAAVLHARLFENRARPGLAHVRLGAGPSQEACVQATQRRFVP